MSNQALTIHTVGHSNHSLDKFLSLLRASSIAVLVDVRSHPSSRFNPQFNAGVLKESLSKADIKYLFFGKELGGRPKDESFYDDDGCVNYAKLAQSPLFIEGIKRLERGVRDHRIAIMCSEEDPARCHRRLLIAPALNARGITVMHIRGDGRIEAETETVRQETQPALFH